MNGYLSLNARESLREKARISPNAPRDMCNESRLKTIAFPSRTASQHDSAVETSVDTSTAGEEEDVRFILPNLRSP